MKVSLPNLSLVVLVGSSGSGKSSFARKHFLPTEVLSSDFCRGLVSDSENDQAATNEAFEVLHFIARKRLAAGRLTVIDATNVQREARKPLVELAREFHCLPVAIVLNVPEKICHERNASRPDRSFGPHVVRNQTRTLRQSLRGLRGEGFRHVFLLETPEDIDAATVERVPLYNDKRVETGPFDIIGDVHGCHTELRDLLARLGYTEGGHPDGRRVIFLGDLVDRGPDTPGVLRLAMAMVEAGMALCVPGNHDMKLMRKLKGKDVRITHGLAESLLQIEKEPPEFTEKVVAFLDSLISHYVLDGGKLVVAHAGMRADMQGRGSGRVRDFALYGETTGETDEYGLPVRHNWASEYRGNAMVVYGHTPVAEPEWLNRTINVDTGCVFGGSLTALRYPEREIVSVKAERMYYEPVRPFLPEDTPAPLLSTQQEQDDVLNLEDVIGKRLLTTRLHRNVTIRAENAAAALEVMSRFGANPKWLVYLPPTMSPSETSSREGLLEHPAEAFSYFRREGVPRVVCEEKHMGSRAVLVVCRDEGVARKRFGVVGEGSGACVTRTGRRFFEDVAPEQALLARVTAAIEKAGIWEELKTDWVVLDCELMPWSVKAQQLLRTQYAAVGAAATATLPLAASLLDRSVGRDEQYEGTVERVRLRAAMAGQFVAAYRQYCWTVDGIADLKLAPFHILASEGGVHVDRDHIWHMETVRRIAEADGSVVISTPSRVIDVTDPASAADGMAWWEELTGRGGEGMVVKPLDFVTKGSRGLVQPALKCRGPEYLRIIYGPEYTLPVNLDRLRKRGLSSKRSLALREFALGIEGLERFVRREPLRRVHECAFGVLALESEPVDPRL